MATGSPSRRMLGWANAIPCFVNLPAKFPFGWPPSLPAVTISSAVSDFVLAFLPVPLLIAENWPMARERRRPREELVPIVH